MKVTREQLIAADGTCRLVALFDRRAAEQGTPGVVTYPEGFTQADALRIFRESPEALYWYERRGLVPAVPLPADLDFTGARECVRAYLSSGPDRFERYMARKAQRAAEREARRAPEPNGLSGRPRTS